MRRQREGEDCEPLYRAQVRDEARLQLVAPDVRDGRSKTPFHVSSGRFPEGWPEMMRRQNIGHIICIRACCESPWAWEWKIGPQGSSSKETAFDENNATAWHLLVTSSKTRLMAQNLGEALLHRHVCRRGSSRIMVELQGENRRSSPASAPFGRRNLRKQASQTPELAHFTFTGD